MLSFKRKILKKAKSVMDTLLKELMLTFERLVIVYNKLLETAKARRSYLMSGNIEGLEMLLYQEKNLVELAQLLEEKRLHVLRNYGELCGVEGKTIRMSYLVERMDVASGQKLRGLVENLTTTIKELQELNKTNVTLTQYSLEITEDLMKIFCPNAFQNSLYQPSGKIRGSELTRVLIDTEV